MSRYLDPQAPEEKKLRLLWLRFLREINEKTETISQELLDVPEISEAIALSEEAAYSPSELEAYNEYWDSVRREKTLAIEKYHEGRTKGRAEGEARGEARGIEKIAINMLKDNEPLDKIGRFTGLSQEEIAKLNNKIE